MNTKVWRNTRSNVLNFHAFAEGAALCNKRIKPNEGAFITAAQAKAQPMAHLCERCVIKLDALTAQAEAECEAEAPQVQTLPVSEAHTIADSQGRVIYQGNANTHKRPQGFPQVMRVQAQERGMFALISEDGATIKRFRASTRLYLMACPEDIDDVRAQAEAEGQRIADSVELGMVEVDAPVAAAEAPAIEAPDVEDQDQGEGARYAVGQTLNYNRGGDIVGSIPNGRVEVKRVVDHGPGTEYTAGGRFTYVVCIPGNPQASQGASQDELSAIEAPDVEDARAQAVRHLDKVCADLLECEECGWEQRNCACRKPQAQDAPQVEAPDVEDVYAAEDRAEREGIERARAQAERLRNRAQLETPVTIVKACANFRDLAWHANTEAARRYWQRRCQEIAMVETVKAHAQANYDLGWDTVVECYTDAEILEFCRERGASLPLDAVDAFRSLTDVWAERQCGALVDGYGI